MKHIFAFCFVLFGFTVLYSQGNVDTNKFYTFVEEQPQFHGNINKWLADSIIYPQSAIDRNLEGSVFVSFIVERNGNISSIKLLRSVDSSLDREALRVVSIMPAWTPGMQGGKPVRVQCMIPINFVLKADTGINKIYTTVQVQPKFQNGDINKWLADNILYPDNARMKNIQGTVYVTFIIERDGAVSNAKVLKGVPGGDELNTEAVRVVTVMPSWAPGTQDGHPVRVEYTLPVRFSLENNNYLQHYR